MIKSKNTHRNDIDVSWCYLSFIFQKHPVYVRRDVQYLPVPRSSIDSSLYIPRVSLYYIFASNNLFSTTDRNPVNQI